MRARISYTVDLEEVPEKTSKLISQASKDLRNISEELEDLSVSLVMDRETIKIIKRVDDLRQELYKIDSLLEDTSNILIGYGKTLLGVPENGQTLEERDES